LAIRYDCLVSVLSEARPYVVFTKMNY